MLAAHRGAIVSACGISRTRGTISIPEWSDRVAAILGKYSPVVEMASVDEAYVDFAGTERLHGPPLAAADSLLREIITTTGLPCSAGLARTRLVAKVASDQAKPRGLVWVPAGSEEAFLAPLDVRRIPGIGKVTEAALKARGIETVGQLAVAAQDKLEGDFGRWGTALYRKAYKRWRHLRIFRGRGAEIHLAQPDVFRRHAGPRQDGRDA